MYRIKNPAAHGKVKGDLRQNRKQEQPASIFSQVFCVEVAFHQQKRKDWKGQTADTGQPIVARDNGAPKVVTQHKQHRHHVQNIAKARQTAPESLPWTQNHHHSVVLLSYPAFGGIDYHNVPYM